MTNRMIKIISNIHIKRERIQLCNEAISRLEDGALTECPVALGDVITINEGGSPIGKSMRVDERALHLSDSDMRQPHWSFDGLLIRADGSVSYNRHGNSILKIE